MQQQPFPPPSERQSSEQQPPFKAYNSYPIQPGSAAYPFPQLQPPKGIALKYGLIGGAVAIGAYILLAIIRQWLSLYLFQQGFSTATINLYSLVLLAVSTMIYWSIYFLAGLLTARQAQRIGPATIACLWVSLGLFGIYCLFSSYNLSRFLAEYRGPDVENYLTSFVFNVALFLGLEIVLGIGMGLLGGLLGRRKNKQFYPQ